MTKRLLPAIVLVLAAQYAQAADPATTGRIFFTPEQRTQLDALRTQKAVTSQVRDEPIPETVTYNGIVRRSDGKTTVWVNNEALSESGLLNKQSIVGRVGRDGQITLQAPQTSVQLKVGQSATLFSGKVDEAFTQRKGTAAPKGTAESASKIPGPPPTQPADAAGVNKTPGPEESPKAAPKT